MRGVLVITAVVLASAFLYWFLLAGGGQSASTTDAPASASDAGTVLTIFREVRGEGWVSSTPINNALVDVVPDEVRVTFSFALDPTSALQLARDSESVGVTTQLTQNSQTMFAPLTDVAGSGAYLVTYEACSQPGFCTPGRFGFTVR